MEVGIFVVKYRDFVGYHKAGLDYDLSLKTCKYIGSMGWQEAKIRSGWIYM